MDLLFISGSFFYDDFVPREKRWLFRYFSTPHQRTFLAYYLGFSEVWKHNPYRFYQNFIDHTGVYCTKRVIQKWIKKLRTIEGLVDTSLSKMDLTLLEIVKSGRYKFTHHDEETTSDFSDGLSV